VGPEIFLKIKVENHGSSHPKALGYPKALGVWLHRPG